MHHAHYDTLGEETPQDVVLLCDGCHESVHAWRWPAEEIDELREQNPADWQELALMTQA